MRAVLDGAGSKATLVVNILVDDLDVDAWIAQGIRAFEDYLVVVAAFQAEYPDS